MGRHGPHICPNCWPPQSDFFPLWIQDLPPAILSMASLNLLLLSPLPAHLDLGHRPFAQTTRMIAETWPSFFKVLRITRGSLNWSSDLAFLRVHWPCQSTSHVCSLEPSVGHCCLDVVLPPCCRDGLISDTSANGSALNKSPFNVPSTLLRVIYSSTLKEERGISASYQSRVCLPYHYFLSDEKCSLTYFTVKLSNPLKGRASLGASSCLWTL